MRMRNLTFHGIGTPPRPLATGEARVWLTERRFLAVLKAIEGRDDVRITFDDGLRSDVDVALPALLARGMTATFFALAGRLGHPEHLGEDDLRLLRDAGMTVASHGMDHRSWRRLDARGLARELEDARDVLEAASGGRVTWASVPFGDYDRRVLERLRTAGYERVFTSDGGSADDRDWLQARTSVTVADDPRAVSAPDSLGTAASRRLKQLVKRWR
jgi:peptidoglycan/xylan/chitin deacetylase (PgdA/CDA1 family)